MYKKALNFQEDLTIISSAWGISTDRILYITAQKSQYSPGLPPCKATSKHVISPGHNHLLTISTDDPSLSLSAECQRGR